METRLKEAICKKIRTLRKKHGYSQEDVAVLLNMSQNTYSQLESGNTKIDVERLYHIARLYKISVQDILEELPPPPLIDKHLKEIIHFPTPCK